MVLCQTCARACCYNRLSSGPCTGLAVRSIWPLWYLSQDQPGVPSGLFGTHRRTCKVFHPLLWYSSQDQQGVPSVCLVLTAEPARRSICLSGTRCRTSCVFHLAYLVLFTGPARCSIYQFGTHRRTSKVFHLSIWYSRQNQKGVPSVFFGTQGRTSKVFQMAYFVLITGLAWCFIYLFGTHRGSDRCSICLFGTHRRKVFHLPQCASLEPVVGPDGSD